MKRAMVVVALGLGLALAGTPAGADSPRERAQKLMKKLSKDKDPDVRGDAARELGDMGAWDAVPALAAALKDPSSHVRANASYALTKLGDKAKDAVPALKEALGDSDGLVRLNVAIALSNLEAGTVAELAPALAPLLRDPDKEIREKAVKMLLNLGFAEQESRGVLLGALQDGEPDVRNQIVNALWTSRIRGSEPWAKEVISHLIEMSARDRDPQMRRMAIVGLRGLRPVPPSVGEALLKALEDPDAEVASAAAGTLNSIEGGALARTAYTRLVQTLKTGPTPRARAAAARSLGDMIGWREHFLPALTQALAKDQDPDVRAAAARSMGTLRAEEGIAPLLQALKADSHPKVRVAACQALPELSKIVMARVGKLDAALATLDAAAKDPDARVQAAAETAAEALRK